MFVMMGGFWVWAVSGWWGLEPADKLVKAYRGMWDQIWNPCGCGYQVGNF